MQGTQDKAISTVNILNPFKKAWTDVVLKGLHLHQEIAVRPEILRSWLKCKALNLDPFNRKAPTMLCPEKMGRCLKANRRLIDISKPVLQMIDIVIKDTGFIAMLTDKDGCILKMSGHKEILSTAQKNHIKPGIIRSTAHAGTGGTGLCIDENKAIQVTGAEHYLAYNHLWTCSSAPIHDEQGALTGVITLSGKSIGKHQHTLGLATAAAEIIQSQLRERALVKEKEKLNDMLISIINSSSEGIIAIDNSDRITNLNQVAANMIEQDPEAIIGKPLQKIVEIDKKLKVAIQNKIDFPGAEINFKCPGGLKPYMCRVNPIISKAGDGSGKLITMIEKMEMINIAGRISGSFAKYVFDEIKGNNSLLKEQIQLAKVAAKNNSRILIIGESGTGKELFAQAIHNFSPRKTHPFIAISCAAIPRDLLESEFFGYKSGAFTGARQNGMIGKFELANNGTLFLDEINSLPLELQAKLLRTLQQGEILKLGDTCPIPVDVRIVAASNVDLLDEIQKNNFREDLYYRLNVIEIFIPSLRSRIDDLDLLINHILQRQCQSLGFSMPKIETNALELLKDYSWPGNIRELENCIERALVISQGKTIRKSHLFLRTPAEIRSPEPSQVSLRKNANIMIRRALKKNRGNITKTAKMLGISRPTLYRKMEEFDI